jgi:hypothetical protein
MPDPSQLGSGDQPQIDKQELAFYEKMKKDLRDLLSKKKAIDKNLVGLNLKLCFGMVLEFHFESSYVNMLPVLGCCRGLHFSIRKRILGRHSEWKCNTRF